MAKRILIIGGYGNLGRCIAKTLAREADIQVYIAGRNIERAKALVATLDAANSPIAVYLDINAEISRTLFEIKPLLVIHTAGPFQEQGYQVASACMAIGAHYIDLASDPGFVGGISALSHSAEDKEVLIVSGAATAPCLIAALADQCQGKIKILHRLEYFQSLAPITILGVATAAEILGRLGHPFDTLSDGHPQSVYGWQNCHKVRFKTMTPRLLGNFAGVPRGVFSQRYPSLETLRFFEGIEVTFLHLALWLLSWPARLRPLRHLEKAAPLFARLFALCGRLGGGRSVYSINLIGKDKHEKDLSLNFEMVARSGDDVHIPCTPAIVLARKLVHGEIAHTGAYPCVGFISMKEYLDALKDLDISWKLTNVPLANTPHSDAPPSDQPPTKT